MNAKYKNTEINYVKHFSKVQVSNDFLKFIDDKLPDMYSHNYIIINNKEFFSDIVENELKKQNDFLSVHTYFPVSKEIIDNLSTNVVMTTYDFMSVDTSQYKTLKGKENCIVREANTPSLLEEGINVDIKANQPDMGDFAVARINRKKDIYINPQSNIKFFVCIYDGKVVGNCELLIDKEENIAKLEDFDILTSYQKQGLGTTVIKHLLNYCETLGIKELYLITDKDDTAKVMYQKCGLTKIGEKYEFLFKTKTPQK